MDKYIKEADLKKYLDKQYKEAVRLRDIKDEHNPDISDDLDAYYQGQIDQMEEIAVELGLGILGI